MMPSPSSSTSADAIFELISGAKWLGRWPEEVRRQLAETATLKSYPDGTLLHKANCQLTEMWVVAQGALELRLEGGNGKRSILSYTQPGGELGFKCVLAENKPTYDVFTYGYTSLVRIGGKTLMEVFKSRPELLWTWVEVFSRQLQKASDYIAHITTSTVRQRLAHQLYVMIDDAPGVQDAKINVKLSQERLASILGTSRQDVNREFGWLRAQGIVSYRAGRISILDLKRLKQTFAIGAASWAGS
jgi:CRP/FNR family transcriptional regulator, cyclic AMP receptor protein